LLCNKEITWIVVAEFLPFQYAIVVQLPPSGETFVQYSLSTAIIVFSVPKVLVWCLSAAVLAGEHDVRPHLFLPNESRLAACPEDYSPCTCDLTASGLEVTCSDVSVQDLRDVFSRTESFRLYSVVLSPSVLPSGSIALPADLLRDKRAENIFLICPPKASPAVGLTIDPATFEFTRFNTTAFAIFNCDLAGQPDMRYLDDFSVLATLRFENALNIAVIESLPALPALKKLIISGCTGLDHVAFPDLTPARLQRLYLNGNGLSDETANAILVSVGSSSSASSLQELILANDAMTKIPRIAPFSKLAVYDVSYNAVPFVSQLTLDFSSVVGLVSLKSISLDAIEGGAFQGTTMRY
jgi:leucine-rich repeat and immunoglobulin-like domain-containing nogo receptor-interacting protein